MKEKGVHDFMMSVSENGKEDENELHQHQVNIPQYPIYWQIHDDIHTIKLQKRQKSVLQ